KPGRSICFVVKEPSPREIFAASFKDRVVHHLLIREILEMGERKFIFDSFACRKNKGTHAAVKRLKRFIRKVTQNYKKEAFYCQLDISGFFMSIDHDILFSIFKKFISKQDKPNQWEEEVLWLARTIIFYKPTKNYLIKGSPSLFKLIPPRKSLFESGENAGLPIGNYSSQFFANLYLNELDQFIKRELKCRYYVRYVDDFILLDRDKEKLKFWRDEINDFLKENLKLELNLNKIKIQPIDKGIDFLGYFVKPDYTLVRKKVVK
ncbi:MAG: RNA-directed DNA polymerase, partial [Vibrio sp.]|nr:RNA-directed DNA polymerase [Vibrio sp.]